MLYLQILASLKLLCVMYVKKCCALVVQLPVILMEHADVGKEEEDGAVDNILRHFFCFKHLSLILAGCLLVCDACS